MRFDEGSQIEMTTTTRTGMFRYRPAQAPYTVTIAGAGKIELLDNKTVAVSVANGRFLFNLPWTSQQLSADGRLTMQFDELSGKDGLLVKAGFSSVSPEGSVLNLDKENPAWDFDAIRTAARQEWEKELSVVKIAASCVLSIDFEKLDNTRVYDTSGLDNHGVIHGNITRERRGQSGAIGFNGDGYIELPLSESLDITGQTLTIAAWVYPTEAIAPNSNRMDFFSKGDYHVFQVAAYNFTFFAGSWGRGVSRFRLPADWTNHWHHITGVCNGISEEMQKYPTPETLRV